VYRTINIITITNIIAVIKLYNGKIIIITSSIFMIITVILLVIIITFKVSHKKKYVLDPDNNYNL